MRPSFCIISSRVFWLTMVEVMRAEVPTATALLSLTALMMSASFTSRPALTTSNPPTFSMMAQMSLPMEWMSPSMVQMTNFPRVEVDAPPRLGVMMSIPAFRALAAAMMWGRKSFFAAKSSPTSLIPAVKPLLIRSTRSSFASTAACAISFAPLMLYLRTHSFALSLASC